MKKIYTSLGVTAMLFLTTTVSAQQRISESQIQPILQKLVTLGKLEPAGRMPVAKLSKEEYKLYAAYKNQQNEDRINPYGITEKDLKTKVNLSQVQPLYDRMENLSFQEKMQAFPENKFTKAELKLLRIYELQNAPKNNGGTERPLTMAYAKNGRSTATPFGTMPLVAPHTLTTLSSITNTIYADDVANGVLYALDNFNRSLVKINSAGAVENIATITGIGAGTLSGLSWNQTNNTMYMIEIQSATLSNLYSLNLTTGAATLIGATGITTPIWLEINNNGNAFAADISTDQLYSVNLSTGAGTVIGALGHNIQFAQEADFNSDSNQLYMASYTGGGVGGIYTVNTSTGAATLVGDTTADNAEYTMFSIADKLTANGMAYASELLDSELGTLPLASPTFTVVAPQAKSLFADDLAGDGNVYALDYDTNTLEKLYNDGSTRTVGALTGLTSGHTVTGLSWNSANSMMYATSTNGTASTLYSVNLTTGALTSIGSIGSVAGAIWLEIDNTGKAYVADIITDSLYTVNLTTGVATMVGALGINLNYAQDVDFDTDTNTLYAAAYYLDSSLTAFSALCTINTTTGAATIIGDLAGGEMGTFTITDTLPDPPPVPPTTCGSVFTDTGGTTGNYANSEDVTTVIQPVNAGDAVKITFTYVDIESTTGTGIIGGCWDYLTIYNGPDTSSPELAAVKCGEPSGDGGVPSVSANALNIGDSFTSTDASGKLTVRFRSDSSVTETGWEAAVTCASLAVDETAGSKFSFYPNPTSGILNIHAAKDIELVEVFNLVGQKVMTLNPKEKKSEINMSSLKPGVYLVKATVDGKVTTNKVIKK